MDLHQLLEQGEHVHGPGEHGHSHAHGDDHGQTSHELPYVDEGSTDGPAESLVLDIGGNIGALVLYAEEECLGTEIDLTPVGQPRSHLMHTMIRRRRAIDREFIAGVYPELSAGEYVVWGTDGIPLGQVAIAGGQVSEFRAGNCLSHD
jgi:hypothetical protein